MAKKIWISGISGSGGSYLAEYIANNTDDEIHGSTRSWNDINHKNLRRVKDRIGLVHLDLTDFPALLRYLDKERFDTLYHIASIANVQQSFTNPTHIVNNNINITLNLLEVIKFLKEKDGYNPKIIFSSTSELYGSPPKELVPIDENCPIKPINSYAASKSTQDHLAFIYFLNFGLQTVRVRMFSYFNPKRGDLFASSFGRSILDIKRGKKKILSHGNLSSIRSMLHTWDAAEGYYLAAKAKSGEAYNVGTTESVTIEEVLNKLIKKSGIEVKTQLDKNLLRPADVVAQVPNISKYFNEVGWKPRYNLDEAIDFFWKELEEYYPE